MRITLRCGKGKVSYKKLTCRSCNEFLREKIMKKKRLYNTSEYIANALSAFIKDDVTKAHKWLYEYYDEWLNK